METTPVTPDPVNVRSTRPVDCAAGLALVFRFQSLFGLIIVILLAIYFSPIRRHRIFVSQRNLSNVSRCGRDGHPRYRHALRHFGRGIDLSVGSVVALTATTTGLLLMRSCDDPILCWETSS